MAGDRFAGEAGDTRVRHSVPGEGCGMRWPGSRLVVVDDAGHGGGSFRDELVAALDSLADRRA